MPGHRILRRNGRMYGCWLVSPSNGPSSGSSLASLCSSCGEKGSLCLGYHHIITLVVDNIIDQELSVTILIDLCKEVS